ncbi:hypothetical protein B0H67DRAFT_551987 [Lasiosphaeris hirsuta]|uniref:Uncharacterized protein n=1 Tax=Lasiosphaeris hirsuta TaxID=260670 RepID=A0AA40APK6_9PEZI|nr:hypothetical protein B0H67DRAFT_551987 [Lasiosphaeris hirsuta]
MADRLATQDKGKEPTRPDDSIDHEQVPSPTGENASGPPRQIPAILRRLQQHRQQRQQRQQQRQRSQPQAEGSTNSSIPASAACRPTRLRATVDTLVRKLSKQNLQKPGAGNVPQESGLQLQLPLSLTATPSVPESAEVGDSAITLESALTLEVDDEPESHCSPFLALSEQPELVSLKDHLMGSTFPIQALDEVTAGPSYTPQPPQSTSQFYENFFNRTSASDNGPETKQATIVHLPPILEPDMDYDPKQELRLQDFDLEVDEAYGQGGPALTEEDVPWESFRSMRRVGMPGGIRRSVGGIPLRYRLSADAAMSCQNLVRSRPRMRKRKRPRAESFTSSGVTSAVSSPVIPPSIPSPHHNPYSL